MRIWTRATIALTAGALVGFAPAGARAEEPDHFAATSYIQVEVLGYGLFAGPGETTTDCQSPVAEFTPVREFACQVGGSVGIDESVGLEGVLTATVQVGGERRPGPAPGP